MKYQFPVLLSDYLILLNEMQYAIRRSQKSFLTLYPHCW
jgi:hypothetical protein